MSPSYRQLVLLHQEALGDWFKMALDLANILDHDIAQIKQVGNQWIGPLHQRFRAFTKLHRIFVNVQIDSPLISEDGFSTVMPIHINLPPHHNLHAPKSHRSLKVIIVDDAPDELINSALVLIGVPNIQLEFFHYDYYKNLRKKPVQSLKEKVRLIAARILSHNPDVILMDHSLGDIDGPHLIEEIKKQLQGKELIFIANTGSRAHELFKVGCSGNFQKGRQPHVFFRRISDL